MFQSLRTVLMECRSKTMPFDLVSFHIFTQQMFHLCVSGVTGLVSIDEKNARNIDVDLWAMTNQETGEYGVRQGFIHYR